MQKHIATHNKIMHADEITAVALLKVFTDDEIIVHRVDHDTRDFSSYDIVIDIGRTFDEVKHFDHHQNKGGKSSAGLIWDYLEEWSEYPRISKLIEMVDMHDVGTRKAKSFEYPSLLGCFNISQIHSKEQDVQFDKAVDFAMTVLSSMREAQDEMEKSKEITANAYLFDKNPKVLEFERFTPHWSTFINGELTPYIKAVVWEDEEEKCWKIQIPPKTVGSFELAYKPLQQDPLMHFVHSAGFFGIAKSRDNLVKYVKKSIR